MASNGEAKPCRSGGRLSTSPDYTTSSFGNSKVTDLHVGWALGKFHALDREHHQLNLQKGSNLQQSRSMEMVCNRPHQPPKSQALPIQHLALTLQSTALTWTQTAGTAVHTPNHLPPAPIKPTQTKCHQEHQLCSGSYPDIPISCSASELYRAHKVPCSPWYLSIVVTDKHA